MSNSPGSARRPLGGQNNDRCIILVDKSVDRELYSSIYQHCRCIVTHHRDSLLHPYCKLFMFLFFYILNMYSVLKFITEQSNMRRWDFLEVLRCIEVSREDLFSISIHYVNLGIKRVLR